MMRLQILTSSTSELNPIFNFKEILELARCSKCQIFILLKSTNTLYGSTDDGCGIHVINIPFQVNTDITFRMKSIDKNVLASANNFYIPEEFPWVILPDYTYDAYANNKLYALYNEENDLYEVYEKDGMTLVPQIQMLTSLLCNDYAYNEFNKQLLGFLNLKNISAPYIFTNMEEHPDVKSVYNNKISMGRKFIILDCGNFKVTIPLFKGLFSLTKSDKLNIEVRQIEFYNNIFLITFIPIRKKNSIFSERIYIKCINV